MSTRIKRTERLTKTRPGALRQENDQRRKDAKKKRGGGDCPQEHQPSSSSKSLRMFTSYTGRRFRRLGSEKTWPVKTGGQGK